jgi:hypothetical protein
VGLQLLTGSLKKMLDEHLKGQKKSEKKTNLLLVWMLGPAWLSCLVARDEQGPTGVPLDILGELKIREN